MTGPVGGPLAAPSARWGLAIALLALHLWMALALAGGLARDELETMLFAQGWAWGYDIEQPPLYNWLQMALFEVTGPSLAASVLLRWSLIALGVLALFDAVRRMAGGDGALAAGAVAGMAGTALFGFEGARHFTHTTLLVTATACLVWAITRVADRPSVGRYMTVGVALAVGLLSKYTMAVFAPALLAGCLTDPVLRARLRDRRAWLVVLPGIVMLPGHVIWRLSQQGDLAARVAAITDAGEVATLAGQVFGLARTVIGDPVAAMAPPLALMAVLLLPWGRRGGASRPGRSVIPLGGGVRWDRVLLVFILAAIALTLLLVGALGGERLRYHYMMPVALLMPAVPLLWSLASGRAAALAPWRRRALGWGLAGLATLFALGGLGERVWLAPQDCGRCLALLPVEDAAETVRAAGFGGGTILAASLDWGANLRPAFPGSTLLARHYPDWRPPGWATRPTREGGACLVLLSSSEAAALADGSLDPSPLARAVGRVAGARPPADWLTRAQVHALPLNRAPQRTISFGFIVFSEGLGGCR
jgi:4-amino-4-deoxy-L-arabinose transferase-like glycosyltransferase